MLAALVRALEARDQTDGHGARVAALAEPVARLLGWAPDRVAMLRHAAPIHDVGKLVVRAEVLLKPGALSADERDEMRAHPRAGASLVLPLPNAKHVLPYVLLHHERWDGEGYPCGLRGRSIPIEARLLAVADAFDAMTSVRPYCSARSQSAAFAELDRESGMQFDPAIVEAFLAVWQGEQLPVAV
ncbi:MAG TPA: HD domain-containing phosphohydrolase [Gaiellaceae bacterium]|jgi:HD-GYP domain-containing protein (c-di-GMP phosphodiesterase class II)